MNSTIKLTAVSLITGFLFLAILPPAATGRTCSLRIINADNRTLSLVVEIADTEPLRMKGLMNRRQMDPNSGMLFVFQRESWQNFWMKNTYIPLSIAYIGRTGAINEIHDMKPLDTSVTYPSSFPAMYALEVNRGWFRKNNIRKGCKILLDGCVSK